MLITNNTTQDYWFGPLHLLGGVGQTLTVDDTSATSLYLTNDEVADQINTLSDPSIAKISVSGAASPFPRAIGEPIVLHGDGSPEGLVYAPQGSIFLSRSSAVLFQKTSGIHSNIGWQQVGAGGTVISGAIFMWPTNVAPSGYLALDGSAVSRSTYSVLYSMFGTTFGAGDGSTTFNLPDMRGRVPVGLGAHADNSAIGQNEGQATAANRRAKHNTARGGLPAATDTPNQAEWTAGTGSAASGFNAGSEGLTASHTHTITLTGAGYMGVNTATDAVDQPANLVLNYIIKT